MIDHERARELAGAAATDLDPAEQDWLAEHLEGCESCRTFASNATETVPEPVPAEMDPATTSSTTHRSLGGRLALTTQLRRRAAVITVSAVVVALVTGGLYWNAAPRTDPQVADASAPPRSASPTPSEAGDPWASSAPAASFEPLGGEDPTASATLTARGATGAVVPLDTGFRLASVDATPASRLAARLTVEPAFAYAIKPDADDRAVLLTPAKPLVAGTVYRFALAGAAGELLDTWAFQARQPLRVVGTLPDNQATDVPVDTGIEVIFDQDGVGDAASHVTITPATRGRFEQHGRTLVFLPDQPLKPAAIYRVAVSRGVTVAGTGEASVIDTRFQFETAARSEPTETIGFAFQDQVTEAATADRPIIAMWAYFDQTQAPKTVPIQVYRLANLDAAIAAFRALRARPDWSRWSTEGLADTTGLNQVVAIDARLNESDGSLWVQLPNRLPAGWYIVQQTAGVRPIQIVLQVTDVAGYLAVSDTRTLVWANDLRTRRPIVGAAVASEGTAMGRTDVQGLATSVTPRGLIPQESDVCAHPCDPVVTVRTADGRSIFLPAASEHDKLEGFGNSYYWYAADPGYWSLLHTDRNRYRQTDTVNLWGVVRDRDTGKVPPAVTVRLTTQAGGDESARPPIASLTLKPARSGAFSASVPLRELPEGDYTVTVLLGSTVVRSSDIIVGPIAKPAYRLAVTTGHRVYVAGDRIKITVGASFFEGTPVPGVPLRINGFVERSVTTDLSGTASYATIAKVDPDQEGPTSTAVEAAPARAEEGEIASASRDFVVFPSTRTIDATARIASGKVRVSGSVHLVDVDRLESEITSGRSIWELDPRAAPVAHATVTIRFVELIPHRRQTGTRYDFIEKKVVPAYETTIVERAAGTVRVTTAANGSFNASIPASSGDTDYQVVVTVGDAGGHVAKVTSSANRHPWSVYEERPSARLRPTGVKSNDSETYGIGDRVDVTMDDPLTKQAAGDGTRYLFFIAQRGIRDATVQSSPRFVTTFAGWAAPNMEIGAIRFTASGYSGTSYGAQFRASDRRLQVDLSVGAARYAPGGTATVNVRTRTAAGAPVAATVILRAVDDKLFTIGAAVEEDPLRELYASVNSGILGTYGSHWKPRRGGEGGDTTGGGGDDRDDFRDSLLFRTITTGSDGRGSVSFTISDDLTSWRVTAAAITTRLDVGAGSVLLPVGLPFFVDASIAPEYLVADQPSIAIRAFGDDLATGDPVTIEVTSKTLGFASGPIRTTAFATVAVPLPRLRAGTQTVTIAATTGSGATARTDRLTRSFAVVETRLLRTRTSYVGLPSSGSFGGGTGLTTLVVSDASAGRYLSLLTDLAWGEGARLDRSLAADIARSLLVRRFGSTAGRFGDDAFAAGRYQTPDGGLALLPYSSSDLELSAMVAIVAPDRADQSRLGDYLRGILADRAETRERQMFALAGLAGLGDPVLTAIRSAAADPALTVREQLLIGLGAAALGDAATARSLTAALISAHGERFGQEARLRVGSSAADITAATALIAVLGASVGDPRATQFWAYVEANPAAERLEVLTAVAYVAETLDHLAVQPASFAYTVDGTRRVVELQTGDAFELGLTAAQLATLKIDRIAGSIGVSTTWREPVRATAFQPDPEVTISRSVGPSPTIGSADLVQVSLTVTFGRQAASGCHEVEDLVPSGLTPVGLLSAWIDPDSEDAARYATGVVTPYDQSGSRVRFCAERSSTSSSVVLRYYARVVTPGTYAWEPAIAESRSQDGRAALTPASEIVIR